MTKKFLNILDDVKLPSEETTSESTMKSESGILTNDVFGQCPKCTNAMGKARLGTTNEEVYYCKNCRVTSPIDISE